MTRPRFHLWAHPLWVRLLCTALLVVGMPAATAAAADPHDALAKRVVRAWKEGDEHTLRGLAAGRNDPWRIALLLCHQGETEAAVALAKGNEGLLRQIEHWRKQPLANATVDALGDADRAAGGEDAKRADRLYRAIKTDDAFVLTWIALRRAGWARGPEQLDPLRAAEERARTLAWARGERAALQQTARLARGVGAFELALAAYARLVAFHAERKEPLPQAYSEMDRGSTLAMLGDYRAALRAYKEAAGPMRDAGPDRLELLYNTGLVHFELGAYAEALTWQEKARAAARTHRRPALAAECAVRLADIHMRLGRLDRALVLAKEAVAELSELKAPEAHAQAVASLGLIHEKRGAFDAAIVEHRRAIELVKGLHTEARDTAVSRLNIAIVQRRQGNLDEALAAHARNLPVFEQLKEERMVGHTLKELATIHFQQGAFDKALPHLQRGLDLAVARDDAHLVVELLTLETKLWLARGEPQKALAPARRATEFVHRIVRGLADTQGAIAREKYAETYLVAVRAALEAGDSAALFYFLERGRAGALAEALRSRESIRNAWTPPALRADQDAAVTAQAIARTRYLAARRSRSLPQRRKALARLNAARDETLLVQERIQRAGKAEALFGGIASAEAVQALLRPEDALVVYAVLEREVIALVITKTAMRPVRLGARDVLEAACDVLAADDHEANPGIEPLKKLLAVPLKLAGVKRVVVSPDGALFRIPFAALWNESEITYAASATVFALAHADARERGQGVLALGDPVYGKTMRRLPETAREVEAFGTKKLVREQASAKHLKEALAAGKRWRSIHLACHGIVDHEHPMLSHLALTDGPLTALDILQLRAPADLVVLSACDSGVGTYFRGEGLLGLTRACRFAGAARTIASLWKVDDEATRALMTEFYKRWTGKTTAAGALRQAQAHVRAQDRWKHPYYWAAWVLWGAPD